MHRGGWFAVAAAACAAIACAMVVLFGDEWPRVLTFIGIVAVAACGGLTAKVRAPAERAKPKAEMRGQRELAD